MPEPKKVKLFVAIPTIDLSVNARLIESLWPQIDGAYTMFIKGVAPVARARNRAVELFLEKKDATHLLFVDADTVPAPDCVDNLLKMDRDVASAMTPIIRGDRVTSNVWTAPGEPLGLDDKAFEGKELIHVMAVGTSCMLIKRKVLERIGNPWFFDAWSNKGEYLSEDINFCSMAKEAGFDVVVDPSIRCKHYKNVFL